jgi:hypothetical protein
MKHLRLPGAWLLIAIPLAWGVARSVEKSLPLFRSSNSAVVPPSQPVPSPTNQSRSTP